MPYIYDHVRTPRGRGKSSGSLHEITPIELVTQVLEALRDRNDLDTSKVDDIVMGCVTPVGEQGRERRTSRGAERRLLARDAWPADQPLLCVRALKP